MIALARRAACAYVQEVLFHWCDCTCMPANFAEQMFVEGAHLIIA